ncbi:E3 SUMO-protein ligase SIZ1 [Colletotrichum sidae]|uniref:E3 SUMO-protein ligase SIZ1 n=2 Tax=Colletotrichum orbiculare species complex TaxID=2707354 RepID=A0A4R8PWZ4_9PEZI|nr:E3 SUMO-protein ligase SIZ1 [Colletotrichum spinosum]TEA19306.1 E3 SUMO-protein ligase SIZ1 [Colletotrichum sidae]
MTSIPRHELQALVKLVNTIQDAYNCDDSTRFTQIQRSIETTKNGPNTSPSAQKVARIGLANNRPMEMVHPEAYWNRGANTAHGFGASGGPRFKDTPFYSLQTRIGDVRVCETMSQHRNMISIPVKVSDHPALSKVLEDKKYRIMVFCADANNNEPQNITFPHQSEIKVNGNDVKANLRGLKNKPGSTRPVDVTDYLRLKNDNRNAVEFTYALTQKKYYLVLWVCKVTSPQELAEKVKSGNKIPKHAVIQEISKKAADTDIVTTSQVLSLKCPISYMRLATPCRSTSCTHIQCFDATSFLQLQEQGPQWLCPICNRSSPFDQLAVDEYVKEILANTDEDLEQVTIEPDGKWRVVSPQDDQLANGGKGAVHDDDDDDDFIISEHGDPDDDDYVA